MCEWDVSAETWGRWDEGDELWTPVNTLPSFRTFSRWKREGEDLG